MSSLFELCLFSIRYGLASLCLLLFEVDLRADIRHAMLQHLLQETNWVSVWKTIQEWVEVIRNIIRNIVVWYVWWHSRIAAVAIDIEPEKMLFAILNGRVYFQSLYLMFWWLAKQSIRLYPKESKHYTRFLALWGVIDCPVPSCWCAQPNYGSPDFDFVSLLLFLVCDCFIWS